MSLIFVFSSCGVSTESNTIKETIVVVENNTTDTTDDTTEGENLGVDTNTTNSTGGVTVIDPSSSGFDKTGASYDANSCNIVGDYKAISDTSFDPLSTVDPVNGIEINSDLGYTSDLQGTTVAIYYPTLTKVLVGQFVNVYTDKKYRFGFDKAWLSNVNKTVYVRTPSIDGLDYSCYRFTLTSLTPGAITSTKVYR
ncbi:hypothetical protein GJV85_00245 [Sulfurimonas aquatica]|uniref:Uncharacterized protein n=1 Tax=Sulfurimonas aquatica TaxID=2672570 RepID=A0A975GBF8_9BACT|nr:hypothetical protein [Sulfurimonas aquatica]QSZ40611.1 hypothetical protein GJV85_00245 [Sulfurimonas aquatica]